VKTSPFGRCDLSWAVQKCSQDDCNQAQKSRTYQDEEQGQARAAVERIHNDWNNSMPRVVIVLKKVVPGMTLKKATRIMWEAHTNGQAVVKSCHKELAELYKEQLQKENLTVSIEPAG
jgi:ATP-dependent Clp protease adaptor protein ClpS